MTEDKLNIWQKFKKSKLSNKYLILISVFAVFVLFFDSNSALKRWKVKRENRAIKKEIKQYEKQMAQDSATIEVFKHSTENLEQFARENYNIRRPNEDVYIIEE